tara:strand:- start:1782 stop:2213 length:432 start_codon:yes stop_codon:yes gene_type:complete
MIEKRFERQVDLDREIKAVSLFCSLYGFTFKKLGDNDIDFIIYENNKFLSYLEVKGRNRNILNSYPLPVSIRKLFRMSQKRKQSIILWACFDGIIFSRLECLEGVIKTGGRKPRDGSINDVEIMAYYERNDNLIEVNYEMQKL